MIEYIVIITIQFANITKYTEKVRGDAGVDGG